MAQQLNLGQVAAKVLVGQTTTLPSDEDAKVTNVGTSANTVLDFGIPQGKSAYDIYVSTGGTLTEQEWLESLKAPGINEALKDGKKYARKDGGWVETVSSVNEEIGDVKLGFHKAGYKGAELPLVGSLDNAYLESGTYLVTKTNSGTFPSQSSKISAFLNHSKNGVYVSQEFYDLGNRFKFHRTGTEYNGGSSFTPWSTIVDTANQTITLQQVLEYHGLTGSTIKKYINDFASGAGLTSKYYYADSNTLNNPGISSGDTASVIAVPVKDSNTSKRVSLSFIVIENSTSTVAYERLWYGTQMSTYNDITKAWEMSVRWYQIAGANRKPLYLGGTESLPNTIDTNTRLVFPIVAAYGNLTTDNVSIEVQYNSNWCDPYFGENAGCKVSILNNNVIIQSGELGTIPKSSSSGNAFDLSAPFNASVPFRIIVKG